MVLASRPTQRPMPLPCQTARTALDLIGSTPVVRLNRMPQLEGVGAEVWAKLENLNPGIYDEVLQVADAEAVMHARALARYEGLLVGISSGANCAAAIRVARKLGRGAVVLTVFCDTGERYLSTELFRAEGI